jgi:hypothetical protein
MKMLDKDMRMKILYINSKASCVVCGYQQPQFVVERNSGVEMDVISWRYSSNLHDICTFVKWMNRALSLLPP